MTQEQQAVVDRMQDVIRLTFDRALAATTMGERRIAITAVRKDLTFNLRIAGLARKPGRKPKQEVVRADE